MDGLVADPAIATVFRPQNREACKRWRERKLAERASDAAALVVEVRDPRVLTRAERAALIERCVRTNMAIYANARTVDDAAIPLRVAAQLGLHTVYANAPAEADGVARIENDPGRAAAGLNAFSDARMLWHTDGYYHPMALPIRSMVLHCVRPAAQGGDLALLDPELAWLLLHDIDARFVEALMQPDALAIPARRGMDGRMRAGCAGPVFGIDAASGDLHMRFTERRGDVAWKCDATVSEAAARLRRLLDRDTSCVLHTRLEPGMGLVCNNVLHARSTFTQDADAPRLMLRARFRERIAGTEGAWRALLRD